MKIPQHVAIILDGNGRWAKNKGMPRNYGHTMGAKNVEVICKAAHDMGISYLTLYAFSTENWNRPDSEVSALMKLLNSYLKNCIKTAAKNNIGNHDIPDMLSYLYIGLATHDIEFCIDSPLPFGRKSRYIPFHLEPYRMVIHAKAYPSEFW